MSSLRITEIFSSLQGETRTVGIPTVFIRLTGCPLRCGYCDTAYAFKGGQLWSITKIMAKVAGFDATHVTVTGGEPLAQPNCRILLQSLCEKGYKVSLETSGALDIANIDSRVMRVVDIKTPGSGECDKNYFENISILTSHDAVKFVICDREDYEWSKAIIERYGLFLICEVLFSPVWEKLKASILADWIIQDGLAVRFQLQLHKILWGDAKGR